MIPGFDFSSTAPNVLVACETSGAVRDACRRRGLNAISCDKRETKVAGPHYLGDVRFILHHPWDAFVAHPDCTFLCSSGLHWNKRGVTVDGRPRAELTEEAIAFARIFIDGEETAHIPRGVTENPIGCLSTRVRPPDQIIQPWQYGADASKATCLWLRRTPPLRPSNFVQPRLVIVDDKWAMRWANQTDSGQNNLGPSDDRWDARSATYPGVAEAIAAALVESFEGREAA